MRLCRRPPEIGGQEAWEARIFVRVAQVWPGGPESSLGSLQQVGDSIAQVMLDALKQATVCTGGHTMDELPSQNGNRCSDLRNCRQRTPILEGRPTRNRTSGGHAPGRGFKTSNRLHCRLQNGRITIVTWKYTVRSAKRSPSDADFRGTPHAESRSGP